MIQCCLKHTPNKCHDFLALGLDWQPVFDTKSKVTEKARERRRRRGVGKFPKIRRYVRFELTESVTEADLDGCGDIEWWEHEQEGEPLYNPTDPNGLNYAWTRQKLTHATNTTALDLETGTGIVIGIVETTGHGADYTDSELGGTGNRTNDWAAIQAGTHAKFVLYTKPDSSPVDPYGTGHGDDTCRQAISVMDNATAYHGSCPDGKVMMAIYPSVIFFDEPIRRMADLGVDVISVSYSGMAIRRTAAQYAIASGVVVVYPHHDNYHNEHLHGPYEAVLVGGFSSSDVSDRSYGEGLTVVSRGYYNGTSADSYESWGTPATAGILGLLLAYNPTWGVYDCVSAMIQTCQKPAEMGGDIWHKEYGYGIPDAYMALQLALADVKPMPVIEFSVSSQGMGVLLSWTNLATTNFDHFEVRRGTSRLTDETDGTLVYSGTDTSYIDRIALTSYFYYAVWGVDSNGNYSLYENVSDFYTQDDVLHSVIPPDISSIVTFYTTIQLEWSDVEHAMGYKVYYDTDAGAPYANSVDVGDVNEYTIEGLDLDQTYYVAITAYDDEDNETSYSDEESITTFLQVVKITSVDTTYTSIAFQWDSIDGTSGYRVYYDNDSGVPYANTVDVSTDTQYTISPVRPFSRNYVLVAAYDIYDNDVAESPEYLWRAVKMSTFKDLVDAMTTHVANTTANRASHVNNIQLALAELVSDGADGFLASPQQVVTVAKARGDYTSIQSAINSISDAASDKIYTVLVYPGEYTEDITLGDYINIVAVDKSAVLKGKLNDNGSAVNCNLKIDINNVTSDTSEYGLQVTGASTITYKGDINGGADVSVGTWYGVYVNNANADVTLNDSKLTYTQGATRYGVYIDTNGGTVELTDCQATALELTIAGGTCNIYGGEYTRCATECTGGVLNCYSVHNISNSTTLVTVGNADLNIYNSVFNCTGENSCISISSANANVFIRNSLLRTAGAYTQRCIYLTAQADVYLSQTHLGTAASSSEPIGTNTTPTVTCHNVTADHPPDSDVTIANPNGFRIYNSTDGDDCESITATDAGVAASLFVTSSYITTNGDQDTDVVNVGDGQKGQRKHFVLESKGHANDDVAVTPANGNFTTLTFNTVGEGGMIEFDGTNWNVVSNNGGVIA